MTITLLLISLFSRLIFLYFGYPSVTHDEADYFINGYLLAKTGSDIYNQKFFLTSGILNATSGVPVYIGGLIYYFFEKSPLIGRLPFAILNSAIPVLFYLILNKLTKNKIFSLIAFVVVNFSPWFLYLSSLSAIDSPTAIVFYLAAIYILLTSLKANIKYALFIFLSFLSFNSYMGIKTVFLLFTFIAFLIKRIYEKEKTNLKNVSKDILISTVIFLVFFLTSSFSPSSHYFKNRLKEKILFFNSPVVAEKVDSLRAISRGPMLLRYIMFNKATVTANIFVEKYIQAFNPYILFFKGDSHPVYGTNYFGLFYLFDFIFLLYGLIYFSKLFKKNPMIPFVFFLLLIASPIAIAIMVDPPTLSLRGYPLIFAYGFFITCGILTIFSNFTKNSRSIIITITLIYLFSAVYFFSIYSTTVRYASGEQWHVNDKVLMDKITQLRGRSNEKIIVYVNGPKETLLLYLFYKKEDPVEIKKTLTGNNYTVDDIYFSDLCPQEKINGAIQIMHSERCPVNEKIFTSKALVLPETTIGSKYLLLE